MSKPSNTIVVQQTLHGYNDGHRLLAGSVENLSSKDQQMLLVMSDASGPSLSSNARGYITGYPLENTNLFAVARTWSAIEMPRPGCVWTHTLLIDFADLASLPSLGMLLKAFKRPSKESLIEFMKPLKLAVQESVFPSHSSLRIFVEKVLMALYGSESSGILDEAPLSEDEELAVVEIWSQQWPRLRRGFRFCTYAAIEPHSVSVEFDLQFLSQGQPGVSSSCEYVVRPLWLEIASNDLFNSTNLRVFLRELASDIHGDPKYLFRSLVELYALLDREDASAFERAVELANSVASKDGGGTLWNVLLRYALAHLTVDSMVQREFLAANLSRVTPELLENVPEVSYPGVWAAMPNLVASWVSATGFKHKVASKILRRISIDHLVSELPRISEGAPALIELRPEILEQVEIWRKAGSTTRRKLLGFVPKSWSHWRQAMAAMMVGGAAELATDVRKAMGAVPFIAGVLYHLEGSDADRITRAEVEWLRVACAKPAVVAEFLASVDEISERGLLILTQFLTPEALPNEYGHDPWYRAMQIATGKGQYPEGHKFMCCYLMARAMGKSSRSQAELIALTFDVVYSAASSDSIPQDGWNLLDYVLPNSSWWFDWDKCKRLREGVIDAFVGRGLSAESFLSVTADPYLFNELACLISLRHQGRRYLQSILIELRRAPYPNTQCISTIAGLCE